MTGAAALLLAILAFGVDAQAVDPAAIPTARAEARLSGREVPDIPLTLADGRQTTLAELGRSGPLLVTFFYRRCSGMCTPFLQWIDDATTAVGGLGKDYRVLALSFDEADTVGDLRAQARAFGLLQHPDWHFAVTGHADLARITGALDFWYREMEGSDQFDHGSLLAAVRDGRVIRALTGGPGQTQRLRELIWELRGRIAPYYAIEGGPAVRCVDFDPVTGRSRLNWSIVLLVLPALCSLFAAAWAFRPDRTRSNPGA